MSDGGDFSWLTALDYHSVTPPAVKGITPVTGQNTGAVSITNLSGTGFATGAKVSLAMAGYPDIPASGVRVVTSRKITCIFDLSGAQPGAWTVVVTNTNGGKGTLPGGFVVTGVQPGTAPSITGIVPKYGLNTGTVVITDLQGTNFRAGAKVILKKSGSRDISATNVNVVSPTQITCSLNLNRAATGPWDVVVTNADNRLATLQGGFTVYSTAQTAQLTVNSIPGGATVFMDGTAIGTANLTTRVPFGTHTVTVKKTGYQDYTSTVMLQGSNSKVTMIARLVPLSAPDTDGDGTPDSIDGCPTDRLKTAPGTCGCGVADTDSDSDGTPNCNDLCPNDPAKTAPGLCGCGTPDTDSDGDGIPNCNDGCPTDRLKTAPGLCGCGVADTDSDNDGTPDCNDLCPNDPAKIAPGTCGCGVADADSDNDGTPDCNDGCPNDPAKIVPGTCGCGVADVDADGDGVMSCIDQCDHNPLLVNITICGCIVPFDTDGDGTPDCKDPCRYDPNKVFPGMCGCGVPDIDADGDGWPFCIENCDNDLNKQDPGLCGCGVPDSEENVSDYDGDGRINCTDGCPVDADKQSPGICGCGVVDSITDSDGDGTPDCTDQCPNDVNKTAPGTCGCGVADTDTDGDGTPDCIDGCKTDPAKIDPGECGCFVTDIDTDGDLHYDCNDGCPLNPYRNDFEYGICTDDEDDCNYKLVKCPGEANATCHRFCFNDPMNYPDPCLDCPAG